MLSLLMIFEFSLVVDEIELSSVSAGNADELFKELHALFEWSAFLRIELVLGFATTNLSQIIT